MPTPLCRPIDSDIYTNSLVTYEVKSYRQIQCFVIILVIRLSVCLKMGTLAMQDLIMHQIFSNAPQHCLCLMTNLTSSLLKHVFL